MTQKKYLSLTEPDRFYLWLLRRLFYTFHSLTPRYAFEYVNKSGGMTEAPATNAPTTKAPTTNAPNDITLFNVDEN